MYHHSPLELFAKGIIICTLCAEEIPIGDHTGLTNVPCPNCGAACFVPLKISNFWLYKPLAIGGMGAVYKAYQEDHDEMVYAVKILPRNNKTDPILIKGLEDEIEIMVKIGEHPCVLHVVDSGFKDDEYFMASSFINGESLDERIMRFGVIPEIEAINMILRILSAESHVYNQGYLYRDIKPENIIYCETDGAYLCDFGICMTLTEAAKTDVGDTLQGSPLYIPPERLLGQGENLCSEVYSLGLLLYHAVTGNCFYKASQVEVVAKMHVDRLPEEEEEQKFSVLSDDLRQIISRMIQRYPEERYQSFLSLEKDLFRAMMKRLVTG